MFFRLLALACCVVIGYQGSWSVVSWFIAYLVFTAIADILKLRKV